MKYCDLCFQAIEYEVGDIVEVLPSQNPIAVDTFMQRCKLNPESFITVCSSLLLLVISHCKLYVTIVDSIHSTQMHISEDCIY